MFKPKPDLDSNPNMTNYPNFKFGQKICDCTRFFSSWISPGNQIGHIFIGGQKIYDRTRFFSSWITPGNQIRHIFAGPREEWVCVPVSAREIP